MVYIYTHIHIFESVSYFSMQRPYKSIIPFALSVTLSNLSILNGMVQALIWSIPFWYFCSDKINIFKL